VAEIHKGKKKGMSRPTRRAIMGDKKKKNRLEERGKGYPTEEKGRANATKKIRAGKEGPRPTGCSACAEREKGPRQKKKL